MKNCFVCVESQKDREYVVSELIQAGYEAGVGAALENHVWSDKVYICTIHGLHYFVFDDSQIPLRSHIKYHNCGEDIEKFVLEIRNK